MTGLQRLELKVQAPSSIFWWYLRSGPTRSHSEHGSETLKLQW